jgi:hypothetical protein
MIAVDDPAGTEIASTRPRKAKPKNVLTIELLMLPQSWRPARRISHWAVMAALHTNVAALERPGCTQDQENGDNE